MAAFALLIVIAWHASTRIDEVDEYGLTKSEFCAEYLAEEHHSGPICDAYWEQDRQMHGRR